MNGQLGLLCLALFVASAKAQIVLQYFPDLVSVGETYELKWTAEGNYVSLHQQRPGKRDSEAAYLIRSSNL
jgi:hypothetical protein